MRVRGVVAFSLVLLAAAVGLATAGGSLGAAVAAATSQTASKAPDGPPPGPRRGPGGRLIDKVFELDPTADQLSQIKTLRETERESSAANRETVRSIGKELQTAIEADTFDEDAVRVLAQKEATATIELRVIGARTDAAVYALLTADQRAALANLSERKGPPPPSQKGK
jgi:Spy/CpxP family protein refolding chaperone